MADDLWFLATRVRVRLSSRDNDARLSILEHWAARGDSPPLHLHRDTDEVFHVLEGELRLRVGERDIRARPGDVLLAPKGTAHSYLVLSEAGARIMTITTGGSFEEAVRAVSRPASGGGLPPHTPPPGPEEMGRLTELFGRYGIDFVGPPLSEAR